MCGISCVVSLSTKSLDPSVTHACSAHKTNGYAASRLEESLERIRHRGPDAQSTWTSTDKRVGTGNDDGITHLDYAVLTTTKHWATSASPSMT